MPKLVVARVARALVVVLIVSFATMILVDLGPGSPAGRILGEDATREDLERMNEAFGFDDPLLSRYANWLGDLARGDFGTSPITGQSVVDAIRETLPVTLELAVLTQLIALTLAVPAGLYAASRAGGRFDRAATAVASALVSTPSFVLGLVLAYVVAVELRALPLLGWTPLSEDPWDNLRHALLPALTLALPVVPVYLRLVRAEAIGTLRQDFILFARAKGLSEPYILSRHALRPSSISLVTMVGVSFGTMIGATLIVELIFSLPGLGRLLVQSILSKDLIMVQGLVAFIAVVYVFVNVLFDLAVAVVDPRVRTAS